MFDNFIWSGCSFSWGSGFIDFLPDGYYLGKWKHPDFSDIFDYGKNKDTFSIREAELKVLPHTFPNLLGKKFGSSNIQNLSFPGLGTTFHIRRLTSFIEENKNKIDLSKTFVGLQITYPGRVDIINAYKADESNNEYGWQFSRIFNDASMLSNDAELYYKHYFDFDYEMLKKVQEILIFYRYLKSYNITSFFYGMTNTKLDNFIISKKNTNKVYSEFVNSENHPIQVRFPKIDDVFNEIGYYETNTSFENLKDSIYNVNDFHLSPKGHIDCANDIYSHLKNNSNYM